MSNELATRDAIDTVIQRVDGGLLALTELAETKDQAEAAAHAARILGRKDIETQATYLMRACERARVRGVPTNPGRRTDLESEPRLSDLDEVPESTVALYRAVGRAMDKLGPDLREASQELAIPLTQQVLNKAVRLKEASPDASTKDIINQASSQAEKPKEAANSGLEDWWTPPAILAAARTAMGGIDLDPCSSPAANEVVQALRIFSMEDDGLSQDWAGRVWMNPPFRLAKIRQFTSKLISSLQSGEAEQACTITFLGLETDWGQSLLANANMLCVPRTRLKWPKEGTLTNTEPLVGSVVFGFSVDADRFSQAFEEIGVCRALR